MNESYISPELNVLFFAPAERLAVEFDDIVYNPDVDEPAASEEGDLNLDLF